MLIGADIDRFTIVITAGSLMPAILKTTSCISASPCDVVAEYVRAPLALAPTSAESAENSLSTLIYLQSIAPSATNCDRSSTIWVCGVIGYADITSGRHIAAA